MIRDKNILIKNIYYMLSYAFQVLKQTNYDEIEKEEFDNIQNLFAAILATGSAQQLKQGLYREYFTEHSNLPVSRGKIDIQGTLKNKLQRKQLLACEYDELSENNILNQILKTTAISLIQQGSVSRERRKALKKVILYFDAVDTIKISGIQWKNLYFRRNNQSYIMLMNLCYFILEGLLFTTEKGEYKIASFLSDDKMSRLFERFVLEFYRYHYPELKPMASQIKWDTDDGVIDFLPTMETDITLIYEGKTLIIDTKYYRQTMQSGRYDSYSQHSGNMYQIFTYVKNRDVGNTGNVAGMLLYAKTEEDITPDNDYLMGGNKISVKTLDLNMEFEGIKEQLNNIVDSYFEISDVLT